MQISDLLAQLGGLQSMARELGVPEQQVARGAEALAPALLGGLQRQMQSAPQGPQGLGALLGALGGGGLLDEVLSPRPTNVAPGNDVLGQLFGSKDVSRAVAQNASAQTGLDAALLKKMLPMLAMVVAGVLARQQGGGGAPTTQAPAEPGGLGGLLGGLLGGGPAAAPGGGLGGLASLLDANRDGNPLDDILRMLGPGRR